MVLGSTVLELQQNNGIKNVWYANEGQWHKLCDLAEVWWLTTFVDLQLHAKNDIFKFNRFGTISKIVKPKQFVFEMKVKYINDLAVVQWL